MMPLKWVLVMMTVGTLMMPVVSEISSTCPWFKPSEPGCLQKAACTNSGNAIYIWENCLVGEKLFTINDTTVSFVGDCYYTSGTTDITLKVEVDAEKPPDTPCKMNGASDLYFIPVDINEFSPNPVQGTFLVTEVHVKEGLDSFEGPEIYYTDDDSGETETLNCIQISPDYKDLFTLKPIDDKNNKVKTFKFLVNQELDFESQVFYKMEYNITSTDVQNNKLDTKQTFFIYVDDVADNKPFWSEIVPVYTLKECENESLLFKVTAQDRDVDVGYDIKYSMVEDGGTSYFDIDETTGEVSRTAEIDREKLLEQGISFFSLAINATEYKKDGTEGEQPNSVEQVTTIIILDCNDEIPTFNDGEDYTIEMDELTDDSRDQELNLNITVKDMDEGINGSYKLTTNDTHHLSITPQEGRQSKNVILTALWKEGANIFNYEVQEDKPLSFMIIATEDADKSHTSTASVTITLRDVNDCPPKFQRPSNNISVKENTPMDSNLLTLKATDNDKSPDFSTPSIRYSLESSCYQLNINDTSGEVTLATDLNYDDENAENEINCKVTAKDELGTGLTGTTEIILSVIDEVDEIPRMPENDIPMTVMENSNKGKAVGNFIVNDLDKEADIDFTIVSSVCSGIRSLQEDVKGWFKVQAGTPNHPEYPATVKVNSTDIDREKCNEVTLTIMAVDRATEEEYTDNDNGTVIITIKDEKDTLPKFEGQYENLNMDEYDGLKPPPETNVLIFKLSVSDPDEGDTIHLSISKGEDKVELSPREVDVNAGEEAEVEVWAKKDADIDREKHKFIEVEIAITNPNQVDSTTKQFNIKINDLNDQIPKLDEDLCNRVISLPEDDGSQSMNNTNVFNITATDEDTDNPYNIVTYYLRSDQNSDSKSKRTPFMVDEKTGEVSVLLTDQKILDRETDEDWELDFIASDQCRVPIDTKCKVQSSSCTVKVIVIDVNDNDPEDLIWVPNHSPLKVDDFLKKDELLEYVLTATDRDNGTNAELTYTVLGTISQTNYDDKDLFYATSDSDTCRLYAKKDLQGKKLTDTYDVIIQAIDGGDRTTNFSVPLEVVDGNDQPPLFEPKKCPGENEDFVIRMAENAYTPGEDGRPSIMDVKCSNPDGDPFIIKITDADTDASNRKVKVKIDMANSTVENVQNGDAEEQLKYWSLKPEECSADCNVVLQLSHMIDREKGTAYNLALHVQNTEPPLQESWVFLRVIVTNVREFTPYFCVEGNCSYIVYMYENEPKAEAYFMEATDLDNVDTGEDNDPTEAVFYFIKGGDSDHFQTYSDNQTKIILKNMPDGLDREDTTHEPEYSLEIFATNEPSGGGFVIDNTSRSDLLHLTIRVGDKNDEEPLFRSDVIFTSFMETDTNEKRLTIIEADDLDLNETLTYTIMDDLECHDTVFNPPEPFTLEERADKRSVYLKLNFNPKGMKEGFCNFTIHVKDAVGHPDEAQVKAYIINEDYQVLMFFSNNLEDVKNMEDEIEEAYTEAYGYTCVIDSISETLTTSGDPVANMTTVNMHFIDDVLNEPVPDTEILELSNNAEVMTKLKQKLDVYDIYLESVGQYFPPTGGKSVEDQILTLKILLAVVGLVLGCFLVLVITVSCIRTRSLKRKVKVLSTNTFGSKDSGLNHIGHEMVPVPGSNLAKVHGNHNPVFNENGAFEYKNKDTGSISSGDSVLVGVEDNPEFKNYSAKGTQESPSKSYENPSFGRSIDEVSAPPPGVQGGMKGNPLLNIGALQEVPDSSTNSSENIFGDAEGSEGDAGSFNQKLNSNFSFS